MNKHKVGLVLGSFAGLIHLVWGVLIALGFAQPLMNFIYNMHSLNNSFTVAPFSLARSVILVIITFLVGYVFGYVFATLWNKVHR